MTRPKHPRRANKKKFMQVLDGEPFKALARIAKKRGIRVQELLRAVIIPVWLAQQKPKVSRWDKWNYPRRKHK
jgi:hypothetical protein